MDFKLPPNFGKINGEDHPDTTISTIAYRRGWNDAVDLCSEIAAHLNGWGVPPNPELAAHIAKIILDQKRPFHPVGGEKPR